MTDLDRASLDRILPSAPGSADWEDVLRRSGARHGSRRRRLVVLAAAVLVVAVGSASAIGGVRAFFLDRGFIGLPPEGATPSSPASGKLEIFYWVNWTTNGNEVTRTMAWVYADGRLISLGGPGLPESANPLSPGFLEQRLTPEGVELLRSEILSTGEFGDEPPPPPCAMDQSPGDRMKAIANGDCQLATAAHDPDKPLTIPFDTTVEVADHGRLVRVDQARDYFRLEERLSHPASWLPESAWADRDTRAYVASKYAVCYSGWPPDERVEQSRIVSLFPASTRELLGSATERQGPLFGSPGHFRPSHEYCFAATTDEARALVAALDDAGLERKGAFRLNYEIVDGGPDPMVSLYLEPYLPHGEIVCTVCG